jgi:hypothetical protein
MGDNDYKYDIFISYSHHDGDWVNDWLLPRLEKAKLSVCIDHRDFEVGVPSLVNMERAVEGSRHVLLILTPNWIKSEWTDFEALMAQTGEPVANRLDPSGVVHVLLVVECALLSHNGRGQVPANRDAAHRFPNR